MACSTRACAKFHASIISQSDDVEQYFVMCLFLSCLSLFYYLWTSKLDDGDELALHTGTHRLLPPTLRSCLPYALFFSN